MPLQSTQQVIALAAGVVSAIMLLLSIRKMRGEVYVPRSAPIVAIAITALAVATYVALTGVAVNWTLAALLLAAGFLVGLLEGQATRLYYRGPIIVGKRSFGYLVVWGLAFLLALALGQAESAVLQASGALVMMFGLGIAIGDNINLLARQAMLKPQPAAPAGTAFLEPAAYAADRQRPAPNASSVPPANTLNRGGGCTGCAAGCLTGVSVLVVLAIVIVALALNIL